MKDDLESGLSKVLCVVVYCVACVRVRCCVCVCVACARCVCRCVCGGGGVCTVAWCVQVMRMIRGIGNVLFSTYPQNLNG